MDIVRYFSSKWQKDFKPGKVLALYGPRQVGKTTLVETFLKKQKGVLFTDTGENSDLKEILDSLSLQRIRNFFERTCITIATFHNSKPNIV